MSEAQIRVGAIARAAWAAAALALVLALCSTWALEACLPAAAAAEPIAYPDLQVLMPTNDISIMKKEGKRLLEFTHITSDMGEGPLEMDPLYNSSTGISQGFQRLFTMPHPGEWKAAGSVPIVGPMIWTPPSDYNFPLDKFWLYSNNAEGKPGSIVGTSPKDLFCMTSDAFVGEVPNAPGENEYPGGACGEPEGKLGLSVGWGDQYEATDGGEGIPIGGLANGTYWLRGEVDPEHYLKESNTSNDITDTKLRIEGESVSVLEQLHPESTPPSVSLESPQAETDVSGTVSLAASASGPAQITKVQFLLDGQPIGEPLTSAPYTLQWPVGSASPGSHYLSAQATDARGFVGTAPDVPVTVASSVGSVTLANVIEQSGESSVTTSPFSTAQSGDLLLAFANFDGPESGGQTLGVSGAGLSWSLVQRSNAQPGDAEIWSASAPGPLSNATVTATAGDGGYHGSLTVAALSGASGVGASTSSAAAKGAPSISLASTAAGSVAFATGTDWEHATARKLASGQELLSQDLDSGSGNTFWSQYGTSPSTASGQTMTLADSAPTADRWDMAAVEVRAGASEPDTKPPTVSIVNPVAGELVSETVQVSANAEDNVAVASVQFYLDGEPLGAPLTHPPYAVPWNTLESTGGAHTLRAKATDTSGNVGESEAVEVTVENPLNREPCFQVDVSASAEGHGTVKTAKLTTGEPVEQLFAFVSADGPSGPELQSVKVSGGGVKWHLVRRANSQSGDAEIWTATTRKALKGKVVKSALKSKHYDQLLTVIAVQMSNGIGSSSAAGGAGGAPSVSLMTSEEGSLVYAVGSDWSSASPRALGSNQVFLHEDLDGGAGKAFWSQYLGLITGPAGELITLSDTAPTSDQWNMAAVEIRGDGPGL